MHQIRREKRTTISEVIVRGKRNIKQNRNWFYVRGNFSVESSSFIFYNFKAEKKVETDQFVICLVLPVSFCQNLLHFTLGQANRDGAESPFPLFSLFLPHLRTLAQKKRSENCLHFGTGGRVSVCIYNCSEIKYFSPRKQ